MTNAICTAGVMTNTEKRVILTALSFFYYYGKTFVEILEVKNKTKMDVEWEECRKIIKDLYKRVKRSIK